MSKDVSGADMMKLHICLIHSLLIHLSVFTLIGQIPTFQSAEPKPLRNPTPVITVELISDSHSPRTAPAESSAIPGKAEFAENTENAEISESAPVNTVIRSPLIMKAAPVTKNDTIMKMAVQPCLHRFPEPVQASRTDLPVSQSPVKAIEKFGDNENDESNESEKNNENGRMISEWLSTLRKMISRARIYPAAARRRGHQGTVLLCLFFSEDGKLLKARTEKSSGFRELDNAALKAARSSGVYPPPPSAMKEKPVRVPIRFMLTN
ncbi:MAG: hypothetical protein CVV64_10885 [Candidatus Wallbacteria bacterium HGW-Wallbacteria-1]|jgi:protein TonB|uniref:TonB C-terminal domain-containing protein n=1 Tax=Candidatus Wallbacteria bacterium HGW-Wallbacteria-1 TaxID=2013854 RepID=A0A2N1PPH1_9BACT|nr:MAG: hypothetical protein CVV64_10885 [Candidatus Wallbacteria bacterium HGW-Wallbacteria-1]